MSLTPSQNSDSKINKKKVYDLISQLKIYIQLLESELACTSPVKYMNNPHLYEEIKLFEEWYHDDDNQLTD